jgi:hypothetical protein
MNMALSDLKRALANNNVINRRLALNSRLTSQTRMDLKTLNNLCDEQSAECYEAISVMFVGT